MVIITHDIRRPQNRGYLSCSAIFQGIRSQYEFRIHQLHIMVEYRNFRCRTIFPPLRRQYILFISQRTTLKVVTQIIQTVVVQTISSQGSISVDHTDIFTNHGQLCHTVIIQIIPIDKKRISLLHTNITKRFYRICLFVDQRTVTIHIHAVVTQLHRPDQYLDIRM